MIARLTGPTSFIQRFAAAARGNVAMMFALSLPVLIMTALVGVDLHRISTVRANLQDALDAAALAAARSPHMDSDGITTVGMAALRANLQAYPQITLREDLTSFVLTPDGAVIADSKVDVETLVANIVLPPYGRLLDDTVQVGVASEVMRSANNLEVALVLDVTGSMGGNKLVQLKAAADELIDMVVQDVQEPYYTKVAIVPYAAAVNLGDYAAAARGPVAPPANMTNARWADGAGVSIRGATTGSPVVITANNHGFQNGDRVWIQGVQGMTQVNNQAFTVAGRASNTFQLRDDRGQNVNGGRYTAYRSGGTVTRCLENDCAVVVDTRENHRFTNGQRVHVLNVVGMTNLNGYTYAARPINDRRLALGGSSPNTQTYTRNGDIWCAQVGCQYYTFPQSRTVDVTRPISNCVTERTGRQAYTDASPSSARVSPNYPGSGLYACPSAEIMPLSSDREALHQRISNLRADGYTAGHIGLAWGWYAVSPNFNGMWRGESQPGAYGTRNLIKAVILMTDGEFNIEYCTGVSTNAINCAVATERRTDGSNERLQNGNPFTQAEALCQSMKAEGILVYTVGFAIGNSQSVRNLMNTCASEPGYAFMPEDGADLREAFRAIARSISDLRIAR